MLNNQKLKNKNIDYVPYDLQISIFNAKCKGCSCVVYKVRKKTGLILSFTDYKDAITYGMNNKIPLNRFCTFSNEIVTMTEIVHNHCMFWDDIPINPEEDTKIRDITEEQLAQLLEKLAELKE
jgi:hypothetical protein